MAISWFHHTAVMIGFEHCFLGGPLCNRREDHEEFLHDVIFDIIADELYKLDLVKMVLLPVINKMFSLEGAQQPTIFFPCVFQQEALCSDYSCDYYVP